MITFTKALVGVGALGITGLSAWGIYYASTPKTIQDKLNREGLKILNLDKNNNNADEAAWKKKIKSHKAITETSGDQAKLKINGLTFSTGDDPSAEDIKQFKGKCSELLSVSLSADDIALKEQQARKWCVEDPAVNTPTETQ